MTAIIETGGKQYRVNEKDVIYVEKLPVESDTTIVIDKVLVIVDGEKVHVGTPLLAGSNVDAKVVKQGKKKKIIVYKMKPKKNYRRKQGHRQPYTKLEITSINYTPHK